MSNEWNRLDAPPPPLFTGEKERNFVKQINDEAIERVVGQQVLYFPLSLEETNYHPLYGEALEKTFMPPIRVYAFVNWEGMETEYTKYGVDRRTNIKINFHKKRLTADQNLYVRVGDFVKYGDFFYEVVKLDEPNQLFGQIENRFEITATCIRAREGKFNAK
jgi:hypothetical protein